MGATVTESREKPPKERGKKAATPTHKARLSYLVHEVLTYFKFSSKKCVNHVFSDMMAGSDDFPTCREKYLQPPSSIFSSVLLSQLPECIF